MKSDWKKNLLLVTASLLLSFFAAEGILRLLGVSYPAFYGWDEYTGRAPYPGAEGWWHDEGEPHHVTYNSQGLHDREHSFAKPEGVLRLLIVGDSFVEALEVPSEASFCSLLADDLRPCLPAPWKSVEVINFGVSGTGTGQELLKLRHHRAFDYSPDVVVLTVFPGNDLRNNSFPLERLSRKPYFSLVDAKLVLSTKYRDSFLSRYFRPTPVYRAWVRFRGWSRMAQLVNRLPLLWQPHEEREGSLATLWEPEAGVDAMIFREPEDEEWKDAWALTEALIEEIHRETEAHGARFLTVVVSAGIQVHPLPEVRKSFEEALGVPDLFYPDRRLVALGEREGFPVLDLPPRFQEYAERTGQYLHGFAEQDHLGRGHWNRLGHQLASASIAEELCRQLGFSKPPDAPDPTAPEAPGAAGRSSLHSDGPR